MTPVVALAWYTPIFQPIGYTNGAYDLRNTGYECSLWCQMDTGTFVAYAEDREYRYQGTPTVILNPYSRYDTTSYGQLPSSISYVPYEGYLPGSGYHGQSRLHPYQNTYGSLMTVDGSHSGYFGYAPNTPFYVGPRGGGTYATTGQYPYVSSRPYIGF